MAGPPLTLASMMNILVGLAFCVMMVIIGEHYHAEWLAWVGGLVFAAVVYKEWIEKR